MDTAEQVPLAQLTSETEVTYPVNSLSLRVPLPVLPPELIVYVQLASKVTAWGVPVVPDHGVAEQPVIVHVNDGAPASATVTVIVTLTEAAKTGSDGSSRTAANKPDPAKRRALLYTCNLPWSPL